MNNIPIIRNVESLVIKGELDYQQPRHHIARQYNRLKREIIAFASLMNQRHDGVKNQRHEDSGYMISVAIEFDKPSQTKQRCIPLPASEIAIARDIVLFIKSYEDDLSSIKVSISITTDNC